MIDSPDLLSSEEIKSSLTTKILGSEILYFETVDSTNTQAKKVALQGVKDGTIIISEEQGGGRGRLSRSFFSPKYKGIWFSVILKTKIFTSRSTKMYIDGCYCYHQSYRRCYWCKVGIKWPNDVLYEGKKLVGILTEMNAEMDCINYIIIGMGINVNIDKEEMPEEIQNIATSLSQITGKKISRLKLLNKILYYLEHLYIICQEEGFAPILDEWRKYSITLNQHIRVIGTNEVLEGIAVDIDDDGALLVNIDGQITRVLAGDVSIRPVQNR